MFKCIDRAYNWASSRPGSTIHAYNGARWLLVEIDELDKGEFSNV
jgi:hypothetical protein